MKTENLVVQLRSGLRVHVERHLVNPAYETIVLVNGALATTASFGVTLKYVTERFNAVCYDLPHAGRSYALNQGNDALLKVLTLQDETDVLVEIIDRFQATLLASVSWGGVAALLALGSRQTRIRRAVICSFSPVVNDAMRDYATRARVFLAAGRYRDGAKLLNDTVGKYLPRLIWVQNYRYLTRLPEHGLRDQLTFHIDQVLALNRDQYIDVFKRIQCPVNFVNGALDEYTTPSDVRELGHYIPSARFAILPGCGHFIDLEGREQRDLLRSETMPFLSEGAPQDEPLSREGSRLGSILSHEAALLGGLGASLHAEEFASTQG